jgi:hypothetical protein
LATIGIILHVVFHFLLSVIYLSHWSSVALGYRTPIVAMASSMLMHSQPSDDVDIGVIRSPTPQNRFPTWTPLGGSHHASENHPSPGALPYYIGSVYTMTVTVSSLGWGRR